MKLLIVTQLFYPDTIGGSERVVYEQGRGLVRRGHEVTVVVQRAKKDLPEVETIDGMRVIRYGSTLRRRWLGQSFTDLTSGRKTFFKLIAAENFDIALLHHPFPAAAYLAAAGKSSCPIVYFFHASVYRELVYEKSMGRPIGRSFLGVLADRLISPWLLWRVKKVEKRVLSRADHVVVLSDFSRRLAMETFGLLPSKIALIPAGVDTETYWPRPNPRALRQQLRLPFDRYLLLTVRRLAPRMGLELLLAATELILRQGPIVQLLLIGAGAERERLVGLAKKLGISRSVTFLGEVGSRELPDYYAAADLFVMPTAAFEGFGLVTLEAFASGTPVVGTPVGAIPEILNQIDSRLVTPKATAAALAETIESYLHRDPREKEELRARVRKFVEERYSWARSVEALEGELLKLRRV